MKTGWKILVRFGFATLNKLFMKKIILITLFAFSYFFAAAQAQEWLPDGKYGTKTARVSASKVLFYPTGCGDPIALSTKDSLQRQAAFYYDSCNHRPWVYDPKLATWDTLVGSGFGGSGPSFDSSLLNLNARFDLKPDYPDIKDTIQKVLNYIVLNNVTDFAGFIGFANSVIVKDTLRGDRFEIYTGTDAVDNGMIFADALGRKWRRWTGDGIDVNITWYGASTSNTPANNATAFEAARDYIYAHPNSFRRIKIPGNTGKYRISRQIKFTGPVDIVGDEGLSGNVGQQPATKLSWPMNVRGLFFQAYQYPFTCKISNLSVESEFDYIPRDTTALIETRVKLHIDNLYVPYASGHALVYKAALGGDSTTNPIFGDASYSILNRIEIHEAITGILTEGADANHIRVNFYESYANKRYGFDDNSTLGCHWNNVSFNGNANGSFTDAATLVTYGGLYYQALPLHDTTLLGIGKRPDLNPTWWREVTPRAALAWDTTKHYWSGGGYILRHPSGESSVQKPYTEGDQPMNNIWGSRGYVNDGTNGAGTMGYGLEKTILGAKYLQYAGVILKTGNTTDYPYLYIGGEPASPTNLYIVSPSGYQPAIHINSLSSYASIKMNNSADGGVAAFIHYATGARQLQLAPGNTLVAYLQETEGLQPGANNTFNLGQSGNTWKDIWATLSAGVGTKQVRINGSGKFTYADTMIISAGWGNAITGVYPNIIIGSDTSKLSTKTALRDSMLTARALIAAGGINIYNTNGTLTADRIVDGNSHYLDINNASTINLQANSDVTIGGYGDNVLYGTNWRVSSPLQVNEYTQLDSLKLRKVRIVPDGDSAYMKDPITGKVGYGKVNGGGGSGATAGQLRRFGSSDVTGTNANLTAAAGTVVYLPAATLSTNRTIDMAALNTDGDYIEIYNHEAGFTWSFTGATVYLLDRTTTASTLVVDGVYKIRRVSGKLIINN